MYLGIEIGGTKLQFAVSDGKTATFTCLERRNINRALGAAGILEQIRTVTGELQQKFSITHLGIGFGGPVWGEQGVVQTSHQVTGWDNFPLADWCAEQLQLPCRIGNDCDVAALAEATQGAGQGFRSLFYITVGTGIGGGCVIDGKSYGQSRPAVAEIGHLRPGLECTNSHDTVESLAAGLGIAQKLQLELINHTAQHYPTSHVQEMLQLTRDNTELISIQQLLPCVTSGNKLAQTVWQNALKTLGWAIAQMTTLIAPEIIVIGGGVSLAGDELFFQPVRDHVKQFVFPPLKNSIHIVPAQLGEAVVLHGAIQLAVALNPNHR